MIGDKIYPICQTLFMFPAPCENDILDTNGHVTLSWVGHENKELEKLRLLYFRLTFIDKTAPQ